MGDNQNVFMRETINPAFFKLENVESDNACFYRAIANGIMNRSEKNPLKKYSQNLKTQTNLAKELQMLSYFWLINNKEKIINWNLGDSFLDMPVYQLINLIHDINFETYVNNYKYFAGDFVLCENDNQISIMNNRWGSYIEQVAISHRLKLPIIVFILQKYDDKKEKIVNGRIFNNKTIYKNTRLKLLTITGGEYIKESSPIYLLWKKTNDCEHYMSLYPINNKIEDNLIRQFNLNAPS